MIKRFVIIAGSYRYAEPTIRKLKELGHHADYAHDLTRLQGVGQDAIIVIGPGFYDRRDMTELLAYVASLKLMGLKVISHAAI
ncbi:hypothetical protein [Nonomuraea sp. SYSU D8015]|uniref:hypothetical protein n=1 Tax=Nonomuraea sp. SYSU D8015 TaxID=2593644 RepID=UPI001661396D|nr:hypothetical protein [Nonomuraea sp. SYSU D8015]